MNTYTIDYASVCLSYDSSFTYESFVIYKEEEPDKKIEFDTFNQAILWCDKRSAFYIVTRAAQEQGQKLQYEDNVRYLSKKLDFLFAAANTEIDESTIKMLETSDDIEDAMFLGIIKNGLDSLFGSRVAKEDAIELASNVLKTLTIFADKRGYI